MRRERERERIISHDWWESEQKKHICISLVPHPIGVIWVFFLADYWRSCTQLYLERLDFCGALCDFEDLDRFALGSSARSAAASKSPFILSSSESRVELPALVAGEPEPPPPPPPPAVPPLPLAPVAKSPLESDRPEAEEAVELLPPLPALVAEEADASLVLALLPAVEVREERDGGLELVEDMVGVVEVNTLEKLARPFMMLGLLRKGEFMPNCPRGLYIDRGLKLGFE